MEQVEINIVPAEEKHLYAITQITRHFFPYTGFTFQTIRERIASNKVFYFIALSGGHTVGFADIEIQDDGNAKILGLAVLKELQGKGIGRRLLQHCIEFAKAKNCPKAFLLVAEDNAVAIKLYGEFGFAKKGVLEKQLGGKTVLLYEKNLYKP
ncbi:MAG: GNAT family N-acetyltransferase [Candidatus Norongarragalinales archaeon]